MKPAEWYDKDYFDNRYSKKGYGANNLVYTEANAPYRDLVTVLNSYCRPYSVMDYGCAKGFIVKHFRQLGVDARGCDFSAYAITSAEDEVRPFLEVRDLLDDYEFPRVDLGICMDTLEHIDSERLQEVIYRIQKPIEKYMFVTCGQDDYERDSQKHIEDHVSLFSHDKWVELLTENGMFELDPRSNKIAVAIFDIDQYGWGRACAEWGDKAIFLRRK